MASPALSTERNASRSLLRVRPKPTLLIGLLLLLVFLITALFPAQLAPYDPAAFDYTALMQGSERRTPVWHR